MTRRHRLVGLLAGLAVLAGAAGCGLVGGGGGQQTLTARLERTVGVYVKSDVRVLGVRIGEVTAIVPEGQNVRVEMSYDAKYKIPADAKAAVVAPSIVSDRYIQLTPVFQGGPVLADRAVLGQDRTAVPVELDQIYSSLDRLNLALGPKGANKNGALSDLLKVSANNLAGNGDQLGATLRDVSQFVSTLSGQRDDLFATVSNLQQFTTTIANNDATVRRFNSDLASVADQLAGERQDLATAIRSLSVALGEVATFVRENKDSLTTNVAELAQVTSVLVKQKTALEEFLDTAPTALSNLQLAGNPASGTLDTRDNGANQGEKQLPLAVLCTVLKSVPLPVPLPPALQTPISQQCPGPTAAGASAPAPSGPTIATAQPGLSQAGVSTAVVAPPTDRSLGGLLTGAK